MTTQRIISLRRHASPTLFGLAVLAFLLPFATVSCDGAKTSFTAAQLVTYSVPQGGVPCDNWSSCEDQRDIALQAEAKDSPLAILALAAALIGLALTALGVVKGPGWLGFVGFASVAVMPVTAGLAEVQLHVGYWLMLSSFAVVGSIHGRRAWRRWRNRRADRLSAAGQQPSRPSTGAARATP
jgi:hypothetical protein